MKRLVDVILSSAACIAFAPLMAACALAVKLTSRGPAIFTQQRLGLGGRPFAILKFRSMYMDCVDIRNPDGSAYAGAADPRVTAAGRFLRATSLDELPQLFNVLKGDMSLVGPRPDQVDQLRFYTIEEKGKLTVQPGITGLAQISGRNSISWECRKALDLEYARTRSLWLDAQILARTLPYVLCRRGVNN